jgi:hypothetical protein
MDKPRTPIESVYDFIEGRVSEELYFSKRLDQAGKKSYDWPELELLKENMDLYSKYLLSFSLAGRMKILLNSQLLGMTPTHLDNKYGIYKDMVTNLKKHHISNRRKNVEIRRIKTSQISYELYANLAIFAKVPLSWIQERYPNHNWSVDHFNYLSDASLTLEEFLNYLIQTEEDALKNQRKHRRPRQTWVYDIRGVILNISHSHKLYVRVAVYESGGFSVEVFGEQNEIYGYKVLKEILAGFGPIQTGYSETVIKERINPVIVCKSRSHNFQYPNKIKSF